MLLQGFLCRRRYGDGNRVAGRGVVGRADLFAASAGGGAEHQAQACKQQT